MIIKKQVYLTPDLNKGVKDLAQERGKSESQIVRDAVAEYISESRAECDPFDRLIGLDDSTNGPTDLSNNHDKYLYPVPGEMDG